MTFIIMSVESCIGIACGCLPGCKPLMNRLFPRYFSTTNDSTNRYPRRWHHSHTKQIDDEDSTQLTVSVGSESIRLTNPKTTRPGNTVQSADLRQSVSRQTQKSVVPSSSPKSSTLSRSTSLITTRTTNANSTRTPNLCRSSSHHAPTSFTTTITAQPHLSRSTSRHTSRWGSMDTNKPLPTQPTPTAVAARRSSASGFRRSRNASRELSAISNASTEMFILQGRESGSGKQSPERRNDVWSG